METRYFPASSPVTLKRPSAPVRVAPLPDVPALSGVAWTHRSASEDPES
jgi:hypothetical protein